MKRFTYRQKPDEVAVEPMWQAFLNVSTYNTHEIGVNMCTLLPAETIKIYILYHRANE